MKHFSHERNVDIFALLLVISVIFWMMLKMIVAMILVFMVIIPYLLAPHNGPTIYIVVVNEDREEDIEYLELEEGDSLSTPPDWEC